jgi:hypothetical protein
LVEVKRASDSAVIADYTYDALGRRMRKFVSSGGLSGNVVNGISDYVYSGWQCVEQRNSGDNATKQFVWGAYIDELIQQKNLVAINGFAANAELYPLQDLLYRTTALTDSSGVIREAYDYDAYGNTLIFRATGSPPAALAFTDDPDPQVESPTCQHLFTGRRFCTDPETA